jgi:murein DD-endopeptidase MepM/ murein hydrolase activator NlpD
MKSRTVSAGQAVTQGQTLGYQGNTGVSFGQHLHFELHKGALNANKSNAINPLEYLK